MSNDPRDKRFYQLHKKDRSQLAQNELEEYLEYCEKMIQYVKYNKGRRHWISLKEEFLKKRN